MTPWQWQDKINYEISMLKGSLERIVNLDSVSHDEKKSFSGYIHVAHSYAIACIKDLEKAAAIAYKEMTNPQDNGE